MDAVTGVLTVCIGVDVGQRVDPTAVVVAEQTVPAGELPVFTVRHLERQPINTSYPAVAARVAAVAVGALRLLRQPAQQQGVSVAPSRWNATINLYITIDATGVGRPVVELITDALTDADLPQWRVDPVIEAATFNHGDRLVRDGGEWRVGKAHLVSRLQALLQTDRVKLPRTAEARALADELKVYEIRVDPDGSDRYGAFSTGSHDDLATALELATLRDRVSQPSRQYGGYGPPRKAPVGTNDIRRALAGRW